MCFLRWLGMGKSHFLLLSHWSISFWREGCKLSYMSLIIQNRLNYLPKLWLHSKARAFYSNFSLWLIFYLLMVINHSILEWSKIGECKHRLGCSLLARQYLPYWLSSHFTTFSSSVRLKLLSPNANCFSSHLVILSLCLLPT